MTVDSELAMALAGEMTPKFMGTLDSEDVPNCVPATTTALFDSDTLVFGEFLMNKTRRNLLGCAKVGIAVITESFETWSIRGSFAGFETSGKHFDFINESPLFRYNAYTSIRAAGIIRIEGVSMKATLGKGRYMWDFVYAKCAETLLRERNSRRVMPGPVIEKFSRFKAVRGVAYCDEQKYPRTFATVAAVSCGANRLVFGDALFQACGNAITRGSMIAASVLTKEPIAYQVKGRYRGMSLGVGVVDLFECYSASPPLLGERLDVVAAE